MPDNKTLYRYYLKINKSEIEVFPLWTPIFVWKKPANNLFQRFEINGILEFSDRPGCNDYSLLKNYNKTLNYIEFKVHRYCPGLSSLFIETFLDLKGEWFEDMSICKLKTKIKDKYTYLKDRDNEKFNLLNSGLTEHEITYSGKTYQGCINLLETFEYIFQNISNIAGASVTSNFFTNATNPITNTASEINHLYICHKKAVIEPSGANPETVLDISFNDILKILKIFHADYYISGTTLYLEHLLFFENDFSYICEKTVDIDLTDHTYNGKNYGDKFIRNKKHYSYDINKLFKEEKFSFKEYKNIEFSDSIIKYDVNLTTKNTKEYSFNDLSTDLGYASDNSDADASGIFLFACNNSKVVITRDIEILVNEFKSFNNDTFDTFYFQNDNLVSVIDKGAAQGYTNKINHKVGDIFQITFDLTLNSGNLPSIELFGETFLTNEGGNSWSFTSIALSLSKIKIFSTAFTNFKMLNFRIVRRQNKTSVNAPLSWVELLNNFGKYNRILSKGYMFDMLTNFVSSIKTKKGVIIENVPICCDTFNPYALVKTNIGDGEIEKTTIKKGLIDLELIYA